MEIQKIPKIYKGGSKKFLMRCDLKSPVELRSNHVKTSYCGILTFRSSYIQIYKRHIQTIFERLYFIKIRFGMRSLTMSKLRACHHDLICKPFHSSNVTCFCLLMWHLSNYEFTFSHPPQVYRNFSKMTSTWGISSIVENCIIILANKK